MKKTTSILIILTLLVLSMAIFAAPVGAQNPVPNDPGDPSGSGAVPVIYYNNPDCIDVGYPYGFKPQGPGEEEPPPNGRYWFTDNYGELYGADPPSFPSDYVDISSDGFYVDWTSTLGIYAVIVKGGQDGDAYVYYPPPPPDDLSGGIFGDTGLHAPINPNNGQLYAISHIDFCYGRESTAITLASFNARAGVGSVTLAWETGTEVDNAGFNLYRAAAPEGPYTKVNAALIAAEGDAVSGGQYAFLDKGLAADTYYYKLEDVDLNGQATLHGPVPATVMPSFRRPAFRPAAPEF